MTDFKELEGETIASVECIKNWKGGDVADIAHTLIWKTVSGRTFKMYHYQECCEEVELLEIIGGNLDDLVGQKILLADEAILSLGEKALFETDMYGERGSVASPTWTFYKIRTLKDDITLRWRGESNGYYSEAMDFEEVELVDGKYEEK